MANAIVDRETWLAARRSLLEEEKAFQKARDALAAKRRALPWVQIEDYPLIGEHGPTSLSRLFNGRSQLLVYHFMFGPDWEEGCVACSFLADSFDHAIPHLRARDVALAVVSRAPLIKLLAYRDRLGWQFPWLSSAGTQFNRDFNVSFTPGEIEAGTAVYNYRKGDWAIPDMPGLSVFHLAEDGIIYHTYSTYARGLDPFIPVYQFLDVVPKGRDEGALDFSMAWVRRNDEYGREDG